jgi:response regulator NasT
MSLRIILVDDQPERTALLRDALLAQGYQVVSVLETGVDLVQLVADLKADVIVADLDSPDRDILESMRQVTYEHSRPVVMFAQDGRPETIRAAIEAGVAAYVVDGLAPERVRPVLEVAIARFAQFQDLRGQLDKARSTLAERKLVEKAKGILMKRRQCDEDEAYRSMRRMAMDQKVRLADIATKIIEAAALLG